MAQFMTFKTDDALEAELIKRLGLDVKWAKLQKDYNKNPKTLKTVLQPEYNRVSDRYDTPKCLDFANNPELRFFGDFNLYGTDSKGITFTPVLFNLSKTSWVGGCSSVSLSGFSGNTSKLDPETLALCLLFIEPSLKRECNAVGVVSGITNVSYNNGNFLEALKLAGYTGFPYKGAHNADCIYWLKRIRPLDDPEKGKPIRYRAPRVKKEA